MAGMEFSASITAVQVEEFPSRQHHMYAITMQVVSGWILTSQAFRVVAIWLLMQFQVRSIRYLS